MLNGSKLRTELSLSYDKDESKSCCGAVDLFQLFVDNNLSDVFSETKMKIIITTPMSTAEAERCFSTWKRVKTFLMNTMTQDRRNAVAILSMEGWWLRWQMADQRVIDKFASVSLVLSMPKWAPHGSGGTTNCWVTSGLPPSLLARRGERACSASVPAPPAWETSAVQQLDSLPPLCPHKLWAMKPPSHLPPRSLDLLLFLSF